MIIGQGFNIGNGISFSPAPRYEFDSYPTSINEGATGEWVVRTTNVPNGTTLYWSLQKKPSDFVASSGSFTITNNLGSFSVSPQLDLQTEGTEYYTIHIQNAKYISVLRSPDMVTSINDTSLSVVPPTYIVTPEALTVNEGLPITFNVSGEGIEDGTYHWSTSSAKQFSINSMKSGLFDITNNAGSFTTIPGDDGVGGADSFVGTIRARQGGPILANSSSITINGAICKATPYSRLANEGSSLTFKVFGKNLNNGTYYWTRRNFSNSEIEDLESTSGSFTVTDKSGSFDVAITEDNVTEVRQSFQVLIRSGSTSGTVIGFSPAVGITPAGTFSVSLSPLGDSVNEGDGLFVGVVTRDLPNGTYYWTINNNPGDFTVNSGSFSITNNSGNFRVTPTADFTTEGPENFTISIRADSATGTILANSRTITINDTSTTPTYEVTPVADNVNEGSSLTFNVSGTSIPSGTYYWTATNSGDFGTSSGSFEIGSNAGYFSVTPSADTTTEGSETFTVSIRSDSVSGTILATSSTVTINDTSLTPPPTYAVTPTTNSIDEGYSITFDVSGTNITNGTYYWTLTNAGDFGTSSGSFTITDNVGSFSVTPSADGTLEGEETFTASIRSGSISGTVLATSSSVIINDTSNAPTYSVTPATSSVDEGSSLTFNVSGNGIVNGTYYWTVTNSGDFETNSGSFTITSNSGSFSVTPTADITTEGAETFTASIRSTSITGTVLATSSTVTINDTSNIAPGELWSWGLNVSGQVGNNVAAPIGETGDIQVSPVKIGTSLWNEITAGSSNSFGIKSDGTLWSWGNNVSGQIGRNDLVWRSSPVQIGSSTNWKMITVGYLNIYGIKTDGTLWSWGDNVGGQLGTNDRVNRSSPIQIGSDTNWSVVNGTYDCVQAIKTNGTLWTWGSNTFGQLGHNNIVYRSSPVQVGSGTNWTEIAGGNYNMFAIKTDGTIWSWGNNSAGSLGINLTNIGDINRSSPVQIGSDTTWSKVTSAVYNVSAIKTNGTLWMWGQNGDGQLGRNTIIEASSPVQVGTDTNWSRVDVGYFNVRGIKTNGTLWTWGRGTYGLGTGDQVSKSSPTQIGSDTTWTKVSNRGFTTLALKLPPPAWTGYSVSGGPTEGSNYSISPFGTNIINGTYYWTIEEITATSADFEASSGSFSMENNNGSFTITPIADNTTEGPETFNINIRSGSISGSIIATFGAFTIQDTSLSAPPPSQQQYTTPGTHSWLCPAGITSVSVVCIGGGGAGGYYYGTGGGGGGLAYKNNISVIPGNYYSVVVGVGGVANTSLTGIAPSGGLSSFTWATGTLTATGGRGGQQSSGSGYPGGLGGVQDGTFDGGGAGGSGGYHVGPESANYVGGGGGAGGYSGNGGNGSVPYTYAGSNGAGGGGGGGASWGPATNVASTDLGSGGGGGTGLLGQGASGAGGTFNSPTVRGGGGGSGGNNGVTANTPQTPANGGSYGGGGGAIAGYVTHLAGSGASGAVRIIWPGSTRQFPSTNTADA